MQCELFLTVPNRNILTYLLRLRLGHLKDRSLVEQKDKKIKISFIMCYFDDIMCYFDDSVVH